MALSLQDRFRGCLLGLAVGDAVGTSVEFQPRGAFEPLSELRGGGVFNLQPGQWTDDTSMALCLATSLVERQGFDAHDQMERYLAWMEDGYLSSTGRCFDIGATVRAALLRYRQSGDPMAGSSDPNSAGNGSLMRLAPVAMFYYPERDKMLFYAEQSSCTTHAAEEAVQACRLLADLLYRAFQGVAKDQLLHSSQLDEYSAIKIRAIANGDYQSKDAARIKGSGYVVESLEAALWCFWTTSSLESAVLAAANLGDDADTTAAICGQLAGAYYGLPAIPATWLDKLTMRTEITALADQLCQAC
jgi:ADP-ribosyl-[dinitrogen reductase] hydrolase